jgi:hypothetical protein
MNLRMMGVTTGSFLLSICCLEPSVYATLYPTCRFPCYRYIPSAR